MNNENYENKLTRIEFNILTLFPELFPGSAGISILGKALENGLWKLNTVNIRQFSQNKYCSVDDPPFGGGPGLIMRPASETLPLIFSLTKSPTLTQHLLDSPRTTTAITVIISVPQLNMGIL